MSGTTISGSTLSYTIGSSGFALTNLGMIGSSAGAGVTISGSDDTVINAGTIRGAVNGITASQYASITNSGPGALIDGGSFGLALAAGGFVVNLSGGTIAGYDGASFGASGVLTNALGGVLQATGFNGFGVVLTAVGTVANAGSILAGNAYGVRLKAGGGFTNDASGFITASTALLINGGTAMNAGRMLSPTTSPFHQGADVYGGAVLTNVEGGTVAGYFGIAVNENATIVNDGSVVGGLLGVQLFDGGTLTNSQGGAISAQQAVTASGPAWIDNSGSMFGNSIGVDLGHGYLTNQAGGMIISNAIGVWTEGGATLVNDGSVGGNNWGVYGTSGGMVTNQANGTLSGIIGAGLGAGATLTNNGKVAGSADGVTIGGLGFVANNAGATISGTSVGVGVYGDAYIVYIGGGYFQQEGYQQGYALITNAGRISGGYGVHVQHVNATVVDSGTISGTTAAVSLAGNYNNRLKLYPGAELDGAVLGGGSTLELAGGADAGTLSGIGTQITGFPQIIVDPGANWVLTGSNDFDPDATLSNYGTLQIGSGASFTSGASNRLVVHPGSTIIGVINGGAPPGSNVGSAVELASAAVTGTFSGINATYQDFSRIIIDAGADWVLAPNTISAGVTLANRGTVGAVGGTSVAFLPGAGNRVVLYAGATFQGTVDGGNLLGSADQSTLELAGFTPATLTGLGTQYLNFADIGIDSGAHWSLGTTLAAGSTLIDAGYLTGSPDAVVFAPGTGNRLVLDPGSNVYGIADGGNAIGNGTISTLELGSGFGRGSLSGIGSQFVNFAAATVDAGAYWILSGSNTLAGGSIVSSGTLVNTGTLIGNVVLPGGTLLNQVGTITGVVTGDATVSNSATILGSSGTAVSLTGSGNLVAVYPGAVFGGAVIGGGAATLELENSGAPGTLAGLGTQFTGFNTIAVYTNGNWTVGNITLAAGTTLENAGTLIGNVTFASGAGDRVVDQNGTFTGTIDGGNAIGAPNQSTLELAKGLGFSDSFQTLTGLGSQFANFGFVTLDSNASWQAYGVNTIGGTLVDAGYLYNGGTLRGAVTLTGELGNASLISGAIVGTEAGVRIDNRSGTIISSGAGTAISLAMGGYVYSTPGAFISGTSYGVVSMGAGTVASNGTIIGGAAGVVLRAGAILQNGGTISGGIGVLLQGNAGTQLLNEGGSIYDGVTQQGSGAVTLNNEGFIKGTQYAVSLASDAANLVQMYPGASFSGIVDGGDSAIRPTSTLELLARYNPLAGGGAPGTLAGLGSSYVGFGQIQVDSKALWSIHGSSTAASLTNDGTLTFGGSLSVESLVNNGLVTLDGNTTIASIGGTGEGTFVLGNGVTLEVTGSVAGVPFIGFAGTGLLRFDSPASAYSYVSQITTGDTIDLRDVAPSSVSYKYGLLDFTQTGLGAGMLDVSFVAGKGLATPVSDGAGGTDITAICFCAGTRIATPSGEVPVEHLRVGGMVLTLNGNARKIVWIGVGNVHARRGRRGPGTPVIVRKGAFADNVPHRDLRVTKGHSFLFDGVLIPVEFLVNHHSIRWDDHAQDVTIYHIELAKHDILLAEGAPAESYRDDGNRRLFGNARMRRSRPPKLACAPVLTGGRVVDAVWLRLLQRVTDRPAIPLTDEPELRLLADGQRIDGIRCAASTHRFSLAAAPRELRIVSRAAVPAELGLSRDPRCLGVAVRQIQLWHGSSVVVADADDERLRDGFHGYEPAEHLRWTDGNAAVPPELLAAFDGRLELVMQLTGASRYRAD